MKICMLTPYYWPHIGGVEKHVEQVGVHLTRLGHSVSIITRLRDEGTPAIDEHHGMRVLRLGGSHRHDTFRIWTGLLHYRTFLTEADVVHCHDFSVFLKWLLPVRPLLTPRKPTFITFHGYEGFPLRKRHILLRRFCAGRCNGSIAVGHFIEKWYGTKCDLVTYGGVEQPNAVKIPRWRHMAQAAFVGRLAIDTGIMEYLNALHILSNRGVQLSLDVFGDGPIARQAREFAESNGLDVHFHGFVADAAQRLGDYRLAFVSGYLAILEALAAGVPVISVHANPLKEDYLRMMPGSGDFLSVCGTAAQVADAVETALADPRGTERLEAGLRFAALSSWDMVANSYVQLYRKAGIRA